MKPDVFWIPGPWRGRLAITARPRGGDWLEDEAAHWREDGLDLVVSLLEETEAAELDLTQEARAVEANGIRFVQFPIPDVGVPASIPGALRLLEEMVGALEQGKNVAVHCRQSVGRSGMMAAATLVIAGTNADRAIEAVSAARGLIIPETDEQRDWIRQLPSERRAKAP